MTLIIRSQKKNRKNLIKKVNIGIDQKTLSFSSSSSFLLLAAAASKFDPE